MKKGFPGELIVRRELLFYPLSRCFRRQLAISITSCKCCWWLYIHFFQAHFETWKQYLVIWTYWWPFSPLFQYSTFLLGLNPSFLLWQVVGDFGFEQLPIYLCHLKNYSWIIQMRTCPLCFLPWTITHQFVWFIAKLPSASMNRGNHSGKGADGSCWIMAFATFSACKARSALWPSQW